MFNIQRRSDENEMVYLFRLGQAKDNGLLDMDWNEIAGVMNREFREDESEYRTEAAYRKPYSQAKKFFEAGVFSTDNDKYIKELNIQKEEIKKERQKLSDERTELNRLLREDARQNQDLTYLESLIRENAITTLPPYFPSVKKSGNDLIIVISDVHLGTDTSSYFGEYNSEIAEQRMGQYLEEIKNIQKTHNAENAYVVLLGDLVSGQIHSTVRLQNRENLIEQIQKVSEMVSQFVYRLSSIFNTVTVNSCAGNHSRVGKKDDVLRDERCDDLIIWYAKAKLGHIENILFDDENNYDPTIASFNIRGKQYWAVHGDYDRFSEAGVQKLVMMIGEIPEAILFGHLHKCSYEDVSGVKIIRSGSFAGTVDDYTISKRITGRPSQMVTVVNDRGVQACYPVELR